MPPPLLTRVPVLSLHDGAIKRDSSSKKVQPPRNRRALQFALNDPRIMVTADDSPSVINGRAGESIEGIERDRRKPPFFFSLFFDLFCAIASNDWDCFPWIIGGKIKRN